MTKHSSGFDPCSILKCAASNVTSAFTLNESYDLGADEQIKILEWTANYFKIIPKIYFGMGINSLLPKFMIRRGLSRKIITTLKLGLLKKTALYGKIYGKTGFLVKT